MICSLFLVLSLIGMTEGIGTEAPEEVKYSYFLPYSAIDFIGKDLIADALRQFTPLYIPAEYMKNADVFSYNGMVGVEIVVSSLMPNIYDVILHTKKYVTCGEEIEIGGNLPIESIGVNPDYFEVEYSPGLDPVLTGDEIIICSTTDGPTTTATTTEQKIITLRPTKKPTAGTGKTSGMKVLVTLALLVVVLLVY